jgi:hypothetical protein
MFLLVEVLYERYPLFLYYFGGLVHIMPVYAVLVVLQWLILHYGYKAALWENFFFQIYKTNVAAVIGATLCCVVFILYGYAIEFFW